MFGSSVPPVVCRRADVLFRMFGSSLLKVKKNKTNTNNINKRSALLQTTEGKEEPNTHK
jgi:hypothetical protein